MQLFKEQVADCEKQENTEYYCDDIYGNMDTVWNLIEGFAIFHKIIEFHQQANITEQHFHESDGQNK